ncbi:MAG: adenylate/guanylate cyclase domain-containing protein [Candidatus Nitrosocosmicus sp.]
MNQMVNTMEQKNTIINLYNSGIDPEIISLELDLDKDIVIQVIESETNRKVSEQSNNFSNSLNSLYLEAVIDINSIIKESQVRTWQALKVKPDFNISIKDTQNVLEKYLESKVNLVILHIDLVGSTRMSLSLPIERLTTIIRSFAQQMSLIVSMYGGYVLKYIGDAVLAFFVAEDKYNIENNREEKDILNKEKDNLDALCYTNAINCASTMIKVIQEGINPILNQYDYPELKVRVGMDVGEIAVVQYGMDVEEYKGNEFRKPHIDLIGYTISIAVKMTSLSQPNNIVIGQKLFDKIDEKHKDSFHQLTNNPDIWNYVNDATGGVYKIYGTFPD